MAHNPSPVLNRAGYLSLLMARWDRHPDFAGDAADEVHKELERMFPMNTEQAAITLRSWGLDARPEDLRYLIRSGQLHDPGESRRREWKIKDLDRAAALLLEAGKLTPSGFMRQVVGSDAAQDLIDEIEATVKYPGIPRDLLVREVIPGAVGIGVATLIRRRPMTAAESAERDARIAKARTGVADA